MDKDTLKTIKEALQRERESLQAELKQESSLTPDEPDGRTAKFPDYGHSDEENASEVADYSTNLPVERQLELSLREVKAALLRIEKGTYGRCDRCGKEIADKRLVAMPTARLCLEHSK